ncbi:hypothetical protein JCM10213_002575 [Rhodosporidiobolus nylandii]
MAESHSSHHPLVPDHPLAFDQPASPFHHLPLDTSPQPSYSSPPLAQAHDPLPPTTYGYGDNPYAAYEARAAGGKEGAASTASPEGLSRAGGRKEQGRWSRFWATYRTRNQLVFLGLIGVQAAAVLAMIALVYGTIRHATGDITTTEILDSDPELQSVATYLSLFILAVIFELGITLDAMQQKNIMSLFVLCFFQIAMLVYSSVLPSQLEEALSGSSADKEQVQHLTHIYAIVIPSVVAAATVAMSGMLWPLYHEFGWDVFKRIGADIAIRRYYVKYQVFVCLLKFDAFFFVGFAVQFLVLVSGTPTVEFVLTIIALPVILVALGLFAVVVRIESKTGVYISFGVQAAGMAYFVYKLVRIYQTQNSDRYSSAKATLTIFSVISLIMLGATFVLMGLCSMNFHKGLRERIPGYAFNGGRPLLSSRPSLAQNGGRLPSHRLQPQQQHPYSAGAGAGEGAGGQEKHPGLGRNESSYARRTESRMSLD